MVKTSNGTSAFAYLSPPGDNSNEIQRFDGLQPPSPQPPAYTEPNKDTSQAVTPTFLSSERASSLRDHEIPEDIDALIADLDSIDGLEPIPQQQSIGIGDARSVPEEELRTPKNRGLEDEEVLVRKKKYGLNQMKEENHSVVRKFLMFFVGPIQFVMELALLLAIALQDWIDVGVIAGLLFVNAAVGFAQDFQAGNIVKELQKTLALKCSVVRNGGTITEVNATILVPGDVVLLEEGTIVPADGCLITESARLQVDQSAITGESFAVEKGVNDTLFQSSTIKRGESHMLVTAIGDSTYVGRSAALVNAASSGTGHFAEVLGGIGNVLLGLVMITLFVVWVSSFYRSANIVEILGFTLTITIVGVPVGLPAVVTTTMAVGAAYLAKKQAIVQKLSAIESLAGVEFLCSDKTGTLTRNKLSLGDPYLVDGENPDELMLVACLAASRKKKGLDAIDKVLIKALNDYPNTKDRLKEFRITDFIPFDPVSKRVTAIVESTGGERIVCVKGAPSAIMSMVLAEQEVPEAIGKKYNDKVTEFASHGYRSLAVVRKRNDRPWDLLGIIPCYDPPRYDTAKTIAEAVNLGLRIKMLTGDAVGIAKETSRQLGLGQNVYNSERLGLSGGGEMPGSRVFDLVEAADGFAEIFPQHKYNVVDILQRRGYLVAMTGDGINDAPSLKKADTGIAVQGASDAARSAADIVFLAPGLSAIIDALKTSRKIFHRMHSYVVYRIALSLHLELFLGFWIAILNDSLRIQLVVFVAIFADIATLAVAYDNAPCARLPVKWNLPKLWGTAILMGIILAASSWICLGSVLRTSSKGGIIHENGNGHWDEHGHWDGKNDQTHQLLFLQITLTENWLIFITRNSGPWTWKMRPSLQVLGAVLLVDILATLIALFGWLDPMKHDQLFALHPITLARVWMFSFGTFLMMALIYRVVANSVAFDRIMHGKRPCRRTLRDPQKEDEGVQMQRISAQHEAIE